LMGMLALSMLLHFLMVFMQNKEKPLLTVKEMLIVISGMKPGVDSYRVCSGQEMAVHHSVDAKTELVMSKCIEMVCESIPGCVLQMFVLMKEGTVSKAAVGSVVISALTTGFSSASISFEYVPPPTPTHRSSVFWAARSQTHQTENVSLSFPRCSPERRESTEAFTNTMPPAMMWIRRRGR